MCGICGVFNYRTQAPVERRLIKRMTECMSHRGPDDQGVFFDDIHGIGVGHRRLSILDLEKGHQPMSSPDKTIWIVHNGEIYNFEDVRNELETRGHHFVTRSDTEVLIHAYQEYGIHMFHHLNGIFACAIWDSIEKKLVLVRDHLGVKPLYLFDSGTSCVFASEIKALLLHPDYSKDIDIEAVDLCFTFRHTPSPKTLFKGIEKLPAGSYRVVSSQGLVPIKHYWDSAVELDRERNMRDWIPLLQRTIEKAVKRQMISDVPISLSLSGGIDSNLLLALMSAHAEKPITCFTIGFENNAQYDETALARESAARFGAESKIQFIGADDYQDMFNRYFMHLEEPLGNEPALAYYFVARLANKHSIKVLLNGQGADELFGGYHRYLGERYRSFLRIFPQHMTRMVSRISKNERMRRSLYSLGEKDDLERFYLIYSIFTPEERKKLYNDSMKNNVVLDNGKRFLRPFFERFTNHSSLDKMLYIDVRFSLPDNLLLAEDKMAMAAGVEARVPFLDIDYVALAESIPAEYKVRNFQFKHIHKAYVSKWLPRDYVKRKKVGFTNPMDKWLSNELEAYFMELVNDRDSFTNNFLNRDYIRRIFSWHKNQVRDYKRHLFLVFSIEQWYRTFFR
jgi:asparagine synthase (glutamine-hydrolysing)